MMATIIDDIDAWLWGVGYSKQGRAYYPPGLEPIQHRVECAKCGGLVPPDDHVAYDGLPYHNRCLPDCATWHIGQLLPDIGLNFNQREEAGE